MIGIADADVRKADVITEGGAIEAFGDYRELLGLAPDVTVICLPHELHHEAGMLAAAAASHLLVEKPFTTTVAHANEVLAACEDAGVQVGVGYVHRYRRKFELRGDRSLPPVRSGSSYPRTTGTD